MKKIFAHAFLLSIIGVTFYLIIARLLDLWAVNGIIVIISALIVFGLIFCFALFLHRIILWCFDNLNEPKVNTSSFRVVDDELLALKEPLTFEQWRDKHFKLSLFCNPDSPKNVHWISRKTPQAVFSEDVLREYYEFWQMCL